MTKKSKIIIVASSLLVVALLITGAFVNGKIKEMQNKPKCVNVETEQQVRYILNMPTGDIGPYLYTNRVLSITKAFGTPQSVWTNEDGLYAFGDGSNDVPPPPEEYMDEKYLEFALWLYTYQTGEILAIEEIEKLVTEGNIEKKAEIDAYYDWYYDGGGGNSIENYRHKYDKNPIFTVGWTALTPEEQQTFVQASDAYENETGEDFSKAPIDVQQAYMQAYIEEHGVAEQ